MKILTVARDLRRRKARERSGACVVEGVRAVEELLRSPLVVEGALVSPVLESAPRGAALRAALAAHGVPITDVDEATFASAADTETPQGVLAVARVPDRVLDDLAPSPGATVRLLVLDALQDPGNVGTILRTAAALGFDGTVAMPGTVDLWNAKVVRSAMGAHFSHPAVAASWEAFDTFCAAHGVVIWGAEAHGRPLDAAAPTRLALAVGNEGAGLGPEARARVDQLVSIPVVHVESLNVAVAAGILMYALRSH